MFDFYEWVNTAVKENIHACVIGHISNTRHRVEPFDHEIWERASDILKMDNGSEEQQLLLKLLLPEDHYQPLWTFFLEQRNVAEAALDGFSSVV